MTKYAIKVMGELVGHNVDVSKKLLYSRSHKWRLQ